ncbi:hypothetical protein SAMN05216567_12867 [Variovorax sp. OK605]|nr:hypothetical protein SAMN05216567_12867 [Variovorax sp. OK605]
MASVAIVTAQREKVFMSLHGTGNKNGGEKRTGLQHTPHRDPGVGGPHVFTMEAAMIRTAGVLRNACATCAFPKAAMPEIPVLAAIALHDAKQTCVTPECAPAGPEIVDDLHASSALAADSPSAGISRAAMNAKASSARRAAVKIAVRSPPAPAARRRCRPHALPPWHRPARSAPSRTHCPARPPIPRRHRPHRRIVARSAGSTGRDARPNAPARAAPSLTAPRGS